VFYSFASISRKGDQVIPIPPLNYPKSSHTLKHLKKNTPTIMIVDDNDDFRGLVKVMLINAPYLLIECASGSEAYSKVIENKPDLILMDIYMPDMDGYETTKKVRFIYQDIPIIFLSASKDKESVDKAMSAGGNEYLHKSFNRKDLSNLLKKYLMIFSYP